MLDFLWISRWTDASACRNLREKVFVQEQGFSLENEFDTQDLSALHLLVSIHGVPVGTARLFPDPFEQGAYRAGRICLRRESRGTGVGAAILEELCTKAKQLGGHAVLLGAQEYAKGFYEKSGFRVCGEIYFDEFCPHVPMRREI